MIITVQEDYQIRIKNKDFFSLEKYRNMIFELIFEHFYKHFSRETLNTVFDQVGDYLKGRNIEEWLIKGHHLQYDDQGQGSGWDSREMIFTFNIFNPKTRNIGKLTVEMCEDGSIGAEYEESIRISFEHPDDISNLNHLLKTVPL